MNIKKGVNSVKINSKLLRDCKYTFLGRFEKNYSYLKSDLFNYVGNLS